jgi:hypothetical protein
MKPFVEVPKLALIEAVEVLAFAHGTAGDGDDRQR